MRIPTLLGVAIILTLIALSGLYYYYAPKSSGGELNLQISDIKVVNVTDSSATIVWQTTTPAVGQVIYSKNFDLSATAPDNRDRGQEKPRIVHFVTISGLEAGSTYKYKIRNDKAIHPAQPLEFKTASYRKTQDDDLDFSFIKPLKGTVLNTNLNPTDEALVFLQIPGAQELAAFASTSGNFVLPLKTVLNQDLDQIFKVAPGTEAQLSILKGTLRSEVNISISEDSVNLPPITIGSNLDLRNYTPVKINKITFDESQFQGLDFNQDGATNSLDLAILREAANTPGANQTQIQSRFDINFDGTINQGDIDAFSAAISGN